MDISQKESNGQPGEDRIIELDVSQTGRVKAMATRGINERQRQQCE